MYCIIMSMKPCLADRIFSDMQECIIRIFYGSISLWSKVFIYIPNPDDKIIGEFTIRNIHLVEDEDDLSYMKCRCSKLLMDKTCIRYLRNNYLNKNRKFVVIEIGEKRRYRTSVKLKYLKELIYNFHPPTNYRILDENMCKILEGIANILNMA